MHVKQLLTGKPLLFNGGDRLDGADGADLRTLRLPASRRCGGGQLDKSQSLKKNPPDLSGKPLRSEDHVVVR